jgi:cytokinesis protein
LPSELVEEQEEDEAIYEKARIVDIARPPKMPANLLAQLNNMKKHESDDSDGITTGTSHPSLETDPQTPADDKPVPVGKTGPPNVDGATLPGFGSNAPPAPPPPGGLPGFGSNVPPPPPMPNGIIPPAPPLPGGKRPGGYLSRKTAPATATPIPLGVARPSKKLKAIHWDKVDDPEVTMWSRGQTLDQREEQYRELSRRGVLDEIERLFLAKEAKKIGMSAKKSDKKSIISSDLSKTWQISLAKFSSTSVEDIVTRILHCDGEIMDNSVVMDFLQRDDLCNIPENVAKLMAPYAKDWTVRNAVAAPRDQDPADLTREDQLYLFTAFELHHYWKARMRALSLTKSYEPDYDEITSRIREIIAVSNALRESVTFLNVLSFILLVGNFMNDPTKQAAGFKISSLTRLSMVKDLTNETTLLDLVERSVRNKWSEWESFADDISGVAVARKINVDMLITDAKKYVSNVKNVQASLDAGNLSDPKKFHPEDRVSLVAQRCMRDARRRAEQLELYLEEMTTTFNDAMTFFGEDPTDENGRRNFFTSFAEFLGEWKV